MNEYNFGQHGLLLHPKTVWRRCAIALTLLFLAFPEACDWFTRLLFHSSPGRCSPGVLAGAVICWSGFAGNTLPALRRSGYRSEGILVSALGALTVVLWVFHTIQGSSLGSVYWCIRAICAVTITAVLICLLWRDSPLTTAETESAKESNWCAQPSIDTS